MTGSPVSSAAVIGGLENRIVAVLAIAVALFHVVTAYFGQLPTMQQTYIHLGLILAIIFITHPLVAGAGRLAQAGRALDWSCALLSIVACGYGVTHFLEIVRGGTGNPTATTILMGVTLTLLLLEATRRMLGWALPTLALIFIVYAFVGPHLPDILAHRGFNITRLAATFYVSDSGITGIPLQVSATYVAIFVIFAAFLDASGAGQFFINLSYALLGRFRGGPAKVAVIASSLMGTINGSAVANTVATGTFTIPLMKRSGLSGEMAGAVEASSSSGGQIMPPVMGAAAFIMVEMLGTSYAAIVEAAVIPALLYYLSLFVMIDFHVARRGMRGVPRESLPALSSTLARGWYLSAPLVVLIVLLVGVGYTPIRSAFYATLLTIAISWLAVEHRMGLGAILRALQAGGRGLMEIAVACGTAGLIIGVLMITGMVLHLSSVLIDLSGGSLLVLMVLTMIVSLIMGMGLPTSAVYIILATLVAPAMVDLGVEPLAAHFFVFYFGVMANVTPPVAVAAYAGAAIARANANLTGIIAFRLALAGFILPFCWAYNPALLMQGGLVATLSVTLTAAAGVILLAAGIQGYLLKRSASILQRILLCAGAILMIAPGTFTDLIGMALAALAIVLRFTLYRHANQIVPQAAQSPSRAG